MTRDPITRAFSIPSRARGSETICTQPLSMMSLRSSLEGDRAMQVWMAGSVRITPTSRLDPQVAFVGNPCIALSPAPYG